MPDTARRILAALDQAPAAVAVLGGPELRFVYMNALFQRVARASSVGDVLGTKSIQGARFRELAEQVMRSGEQLHLHELAWDIVQGGGRAYFDVLLHPLRDGGDVEGLVIIGTEVTELVEARAALEAQSERTRRAETQLNAVLEQAPLVVLTLDPAGKVLFAAGGEVLRIGTEPAHLIGRNAQELFEGDPASLAILRRALEGASFNALVPRPGGVTFEVYFTPVRNREGELEMVVAVGVNVTRRLRAEEERARIQEKMLQTQKLESLGVLAGGIAHDFNNLLTVIQGNAMVARAQMDDGAPGAPLLDDILAAARRASELTRQMLAYSGKARFEIRPLDLRQQVGEIGKLLRTSISRRVHLRIEQPSFLPAVQGDPSQLQQVAMNLLLNAAEAIGDRGGEVLVRLAEEQVGEDGGGDLFGRERLPPGRYVRLSVQDTGDGMDPQVKARIFDPFFTTKSTGRGLGLAAVLGIVRAHGGAIRIDSAKERGTRFEVLIPAAGARAAPEPGAENHVEAGRGTVLVIDDEQQVRTATARMLASLGYDVLEAPDGTRGLEIFRLRRGAIDAVLLDLTMPGLSGEETLQGLREVDADARVILYTGYAGEEVARRLGPLEPAAVLQKPFTRQQLGAAVQAALDDKG